ncbi:MAG: YitT family protein, partial [Collinsella sp.]
ADDAETAPPGAVSVPDRCFRPLSWAYAGISPTETTEEPFKATGMYSGAEKPVIMVIVSRRELNTLKTIVRERDPQAIVTVADVTEAFGEGFKDINA